VTPFQRRCLDLVHAIPPGRWATYGDIAAQVGSKGRGVASALLALRRNDRDRSGQYRPGQSLAPWWRLRVADGSLHVPPSHWGAEERAVEDHRNEIYAEEGGSCATDAPFLSSAIASTPGRLTLA
jgi:alkylated DNA nucleotide flippase Atl1